MQALPLGSSCPWPARATKARIEQGTEHTLLLQGSLCRQHTGSVCGMLCSKTAIVATATSLHGQPAPGPLADIISDS